MGEGRDGTALGILPERRVGDIEEVMRIQRHGDGIQAVLAAVDQSGQALHVGVGAVDRQRGGKASTLRIDRAIGGGQVAEVVLRVDDEQVSLGHAVLLGFRVPGG